MVRWGQTPQQTIAAEMEFGEVAEHAKQFSTALYGELTLRLDGGPFSKLHAVGQGKGLDAVRHVMSRYEPRAVQSKRSDLKHIITTPQSKGSERAWRFVS